MTLDSPVAISLVVVAARMRRRVTVLVLRVCVCVCLCVCYAATSFVSTLDSRYVRVYYRLFLIFNSWIFDKPFLSEVMA